MNDELWLEYLKETRPDLYEQAITFINKQMAINEKTKTDLQQIELVVERYQNLIASNYIFGGK